MTVRYLIRKYPNKSKKWILNLHMTTVRGDRWNLYDGNPDNYLQKMSRIPIVRHVKVRKDVRVYDTEATRVLGK